VVPVCKRSNGTKTV